MDTTIAVSDRGGARAGCGAQHVCANRAGTCKWRSLLQTVTSFDDISGARRRRRSRRSSMAWPASRRGWSAVPRRQPRGRDLGRRHPAGSRDAAATRPPLPVGGYSLLWSEGEYANSWFVGGGVTWWTSEWLGVRLELRDHIVTDDTTVHLMVVRGGDRLQVTRCALPARLATDNRNMRRDRQVGIHRSVPVCQGRCPTGGPMTARCCGVLVVRSLGLDCRGVPSILAGRPAGRFHRAEREDGQRGDTSPSRCIASRVDHRRGIATL